MLTSVALHAESVEQIVEAFAKAGKARRVELANQFFRILDKEQFTDELVQFSPKSAPDSVEMNVWFWAGEYALDAARYDQAIGYMKRATDISHDRNDREMESDCLNELAVCYFKKGELTKATRYAKACYDLTEQLHDDERLTYSLNTITSIYVAAKQAQEARKYNERAIALAEKTGNQGLIANRWGMASEISHLEGREQEAYDNAHKAYGLHLALGDTAKAAIRQVQMATALIALQRYGEAKRLMESAIPVLKAEQNVLSLGICYNQMGDVMLEQHDNAAARDYYAKALNIFQHIGNQYHESHSSFGLYQALRDSDPQQAMTHLGHYAALKDSIYHHDMRNLLADYDAQYDNDTLAEENEAEHRYTRQLIMGGVAILLVVIAALAFLVYALRLKSRAAQLNRELQVAHERFFTNITHEFRTPLAVINAATEEIRSEVRGEKSEVRGEKGEGRGEAIMKHAENISRSSKSLLNLINQILDIAKLNSLTHAKKLSRALSGLIHHEEDTAPWRTDDVVAFVGMMCESYKDYAQHQGITLLYGHKESAVTMDFIPDYLRKILRNLISNAIKFSNEGGQVLVHTEVVDGQLQLIVDDEGIGIAHDEVSHIFEPFYQAENDSQNIGTGVGLSLAKLATEAMDGHIEVHSAPGEGSVFIVTLPLRHGKGNWKHVDDVDRTEEKVDLPAKIADSIDSEADEDNVRILIVEDAPEVAEYMAHNLQGDYSVFFARNGQEGLEKARMLVPDMIVTDIMMPLMDGYELCREVRSDALLSHIPVIMVTAKVTKDDRMRGLEAGADAWLEKPFHSDELRLRMQKLMEQRHHLKNYYAQLASNTPASSSQPADHEAETSPLRPALLEDSQREFAEHIAALIEQQMDNHKIDLNEVASELCITRVQLTRKLKAITGMNTRDYANMVRINRAKHLLDNSELTISEIAMKCGIEDVAYFSRFFRKLAGCTPSEYIARRVEA